MYERMLNKQVAPSFEDMAAYCGENAELFTLLNEWLCGDGGWIHYRVTCKEHFDDIKKLLAVKCS